MVEPGRKPQFKKIPALKPTNTWRIQQWLEYIGTKDISEWRSLIKLCNATGHTWKNCMFNGYAVQCIICEQMRLRKRVGQG